MRLGNTGEGPPEDPECGRPLDLSALRADDALLDALGAGLIRPDEPYEGCAESDRELVSLLAAWVAQVRPPESEPLPEPDPVPALAGAPIRQLAAVPEPPPLSTAPPVELPTTPSPNRYRALLTQFGRRLAVAALLTGLASSGLAVGISAEPGAASAAVSRVAYAERARSMAAASLATDELDTARQALEQGRRAEAARLITSVGEKLPSGPSRRRAGRARS